MSPPTYIGKKEFSMCYNLSLIFCTSILLFVQHLTFCSSCLFISSSPFYPLMHICLLLFSLLSSIPFLYELSLFLIFLLFTYLLHEVIPICSSPYMSPPNYLAKQKFSISYNLLQPYFLYSICLPVLVTAFLYISLYCKVHISFGKLIFG